MFKNLVKIMAKLTGRKCSRCSHNLNGTCTQPQSIYKKCWQSLGRPGFAEKLAEPKEAALTKEQEYELQKIRETLQEAKDIAQESGLVEDL